jgi:hypothetical protein
VAARTRTLVNPDQQALALVQNSEQLRLLGALPADGSSACIYSNEEYAAADEREHEAINARIVAATALTERGLVRNHIYEYSLSERGKRLVAAGLPKQLPALTAKEALALINDSDIQGLFASDGDPSSLDRYYPEEVGTFDLDNSYDNGYERGTGAVFGWVRDILARVV